MLITVGSALGAKADTELRRKARAIDAIKRLETIPARRRPIARKVFGSSAAIFVPMTVMLELESVLRAFPPIAARWW